MVKPAMKKEVAGYIQDEHKLSKRRSCALVGIPTCTVRYQSRRGDETPIRARLKELAQERPRFGSTQRVPRRLGVLLRREGHLTQPEARAACLPRGESETTCPQKTESDQYPARETCSNVWDQSDVEYGLHARYFERWTALSQFEYCGLFQSRSLGD